MHPRTAAINEAQKKSSKKARTEALNWLVLTYPKAFDTTLRIVPLKIGIMQDILLAAPEAAKAGISKTALRKAVVRFTRQLAYLFCLKGREGRIDLNGNMVAHVTEEEAEKAAAKIKRHLEKTARNAQKAGYESAVLLSTSDTVIANKTLPVYPPRAVPKAQSFAAAPTADTVILKRKSTRSFDPEAVARLKEKLGLSQGVKQPADSPVALPPEASSSCAVPSDVVKQMHTSS